MKNNEVIGVLDIDSEKLATFDAAQDGHGGSTEVIARVNAPTEQTASAQPFTEPASPADNTPVQTGSSGFWIIASVICMTTAWLLIVRARSKPSK